MRKKSVFISLAALVVGFGLLFYILQRVSFTVRIEHTLNAPVEKVWALWNDPEMIKQWWGPKDYSAPVVQNELRVGGSFLLSMKGADDKVIYNSGTYIDVIPNQRISSTMSFADENGQSVPASHYGLPGNWPNEVGIVVEFKDLGDKTRILVTETGIPGIMYVFAKMGWAQQFDKFEALLK